MAATKKIRVDRTYSTDNDTEDKGAASLVEKARQLNTSRTINGVGFNGTANISFGTDSVSEGSTNLYFTNARARSALSGSTGISYNSSTGAISCTITQYADSNARAAISASGGGLSYNSTTGALSLSYPSTSNVSEGSNLYYTDARARAAVSFTAGSGAYNSTTGVFTIPTNTNQLTNGAGFVTSSGVTSVAAGSYLTGGTITSTGTLAVDATNLNTASKVVARDASGNFSAGTITATLSGNATTATTLQTARAINGVSFNGSADVTVHTAGTGISISGTTVTNTLSTSGGSIGGAIAVSGAITATGEITAYYSDERLKTNVTKIDSALEKVMAINGYTYDSSELAESLGLPKHMDQIGLMAQEVEAVLPELVTQSGIAGYKTIRYDKVVSVLVNAIKEQQAMIEELRKDVKKTLH